MRLVLYLRVSTEEQAKEGVSLASQEARLTAWAAALGHEVVGVFRDEGVSGSVSPAQRDGFRGGLERVEAGEADGIAAVALDRLSRSTRDVLDLVDRAERAGWALVSLREQLDTGSAIGRFVTTVLAALCQMERELIGERTSAALEELRGQRRRFTRVAPLGWRLTQEGRMEPAEREVLALAAIRATLDLTGAEAALRVQELSGDHPRSGGPWRPKDVYTARRSLRRGDQFTGRPAGS